jgi:tetratricopeptide (TPR) repeat protein
VFQSSPDKVKSLYKSFKYIVFVDPKEELQFYRDVADAVEPSHAAFPKSESFAFVSEDATANIGRLLSDDPVRRREAEPYLSKTIESFGKKGVMNDISHFSEDFATYCGAYARRAQMYAATQRIDLMMADVRKMTDACTPALNKYPWDFYLRQNFWSDARVAGQALFDVHRYKDALPNLEYASHWGIADSSRLLARMYREGLGVPKDEPKAKGLETLASGQKMERFTISADFGGVKAPFYFYVRDWPTDYPFEGIDDQIKWLKEARGGAVPPEVTDSFHKLAKIARENKVSFRELVVYALGESDKGKAASTGSKASNETEAGPNERAKPQYERAQSLVKQEKWTEAAQAAENALGLDPESADVLELAENIYHDRLFQFDRAFELNSKRVELGAGGDDFVEKHLTTARFETCAALAGMRLSEVSDKRIRLAWISTRPTAPKI